MDTEEKIKEKHFWIHKIWEKNDHRIFIHWAKDDCLSIEPTIGQQIGFGITIGDEEDDISLHIQLFIGVYLGLSFDPLRKFINKHPNYSYDHGNGNKGSYFNERSIYLKIYRSTFGKDDINISGGFWVDMDDEPRKRHIYLGIKDMLFGRDKYSEVVLEEGKTTITMPEKEYEATTKIFESTWTRSRFPFLKKKLKRITIDIPGGIPHPGKGENSWDCGDDALNGMTMAFKSLEESKQSIIDSVMRYRNNY